ncbi:hypothetical protein [Streptomyces sp. CS-7]|uniref:hypothetical protein n=1 Tax=Streptomyces sp. CS-7 TaxID=2906769 RepID=UPI0037DA6737
MSCRSPVNMVGVDHHHGQVVAVAGQETASAGGVGVAAQQPGQRVAAGGGEALVQGDGVDGPAGQRYGGGGDQEGVRADPAR